MTAERSTKQKKKKTPTAETRLLLHNLEIEKTSPRGPCNRASPWYVDGAAGEPLVDSSAYSALEPPRSARATKRARRSTEVVE